MNEITSENGLSTKDRMIRGESLPGIDLIDKSLLSSNEVKYLGHLVRDLKLKRAIHEGHTRLLKDPEIMVLERSEVIEFTDSKTEDVSIHGTFQSEGPLRSKQTKMPRVTTNIVKDAIDFGYRNCFEYSAVQSLLAVKFGMINVTIVPYSDYGSSSNSLLHKLGFHDHYGVLYEDPKEGKRYVMSYSGINYQLDSTPVQEIRQYVDKYISSHEYKEEITDQKKKGFESDLQGLIRAVRHHNSNIN